MSRITPTRATPGDAPSAAGRPLVVDLDGSLARTDTLIESVRVLAGRPITLLRALFALCHGRARLKQALAAAADLDAATLPYNRGPLSYLREERQQGRLLVLATAADRQTAQAVAQHLGLFDIVLASDGGTNLKGGAKLAAIRDGLDGAPFTYVGDSRADLAVWREAASGICVAARPRVARAAARLTVIERSFIALFALFAAAASPVVAAPSSEAVGEHGMVVSAQHEASAVGLGVLHAGGSAIDAAVAVGYALAVVDPCCGNIGGGGFMLVHRADGSGGAHDSVINFRETAPRAATPGMFLDAAGGVVKGASLYGYRAAGVPGTVLGLDRALSAYGRLARPAVMAPAIALARDGFVLGAGDAASIGRKAAQLAADPGAARIFLHADGSPYQAGERLVQADLAATLTLVAERGPDAFYHGPIAAAVAMASAAHGGLMTIEDFADYTVVETAPVSCLYRGYLVLSAPPPSAGGTILCEMLGVLSGWDLKAAGIASPQSLHLMAETMRHAYVDRNTVMGDPDFVADPRARLLSPGHAAQIRSAIDPEKATPSATLGPGAAPHERAETTHYSVVDGEGNAVSVTYTLNGGFGAGVVAPGTGFLLNNEMDDFTVKPGAPNLFGLVQGTANAIAPGKRPLSSMTPTIVEKDGKPVFVLGSPGGPRIITAVLETLVNLVDFGRSPQEAVAAPRFHHQFLPDTLYLERGGFPPDTLAALVERGYRLTEQEPWGAVELIQIGPGHHVVGINDPRRPEGSAIGD